MKLKFWSPSRAQRSPPRLGTAHIVSRSFRPPGLNTASSHFIGGSNTPVPIGPVALGDLVREDKLLWVYCCDCYHERDVGPATVPLPPPVPEISKRMKSACGSRKIDARPEQYPGGVTKMR